VSARSGQVGFAKPNPGLSLMDGKALTGASVWPTAVGQVGVGKVRGAAWEQGLPQGSGWVGAKWERGEAGQGAKACGCRELGRKGRGGRVAV